MNDQMRDLMPERVARELVSGIADDKKAALGLNPAGPGLKSSGTLKLLPVGRLLKNVDVGFGIAEGLLAEEFDLEALEPGDFRRERPNFQEPRYSRIRALTAQLAAIGREHGRPSHHVALAWMRSRDGLTGAIVGARSEREARDLADAAGWDAPAGVVECVDRVLRTGGW